MNINPNKQYSESQRKMIRRHLEQGKSITQLDALIQYGCFRLSSVIYDLRHEGLNVKMCWHKLANGKKLGIYSL